MLCYVVVETYSLICPVLHVVVCSHGNVMLGLARMDVLGWGWQGWMSWAGVGKGGCLGLG